MEVKFKMMYKAIIKHPIKGYSSFPVDVDDNNKHLALAEANMQLTRCQMGEYENGDTEFNNFIKNEYAGYEVVSVQPYPIIDIHDNNDCKPQSSHDIMPIIAPMQNKEGNLNNLEDDNMVFFNVNWNDYVDDILKLASPETWSNDTYPNNGMLVNYMVHTYRKLKSEKNIIITDEYGLFNTGLFTQYYEPMYAYSTSSKAISFVTEYDLGKLGIESYPERANYFDNPELLIFDWHYKININFKHILEDNKSRINIPKDILESKNLLNTFNGAIDTMKKRVSANYKLAVPQYFEEKVQLLLPLCLHLDNVPDLALVVTKAGNIYQGHTCLTLDMAYNNARLIAKPESNWLSP